jgi:hypothetical protein
MTKVNVKNGTPVGSSSLCETCSAAQIITGFRDSELIVRCIYSYDSPIVVPFKVYDCTAYRDKNRPDYHQMEKFALVINETTFSKPAGFVLGDDDE